MYPCVRADDVDQKRNKARTVADSFRGFRMQTFIILVSVKLFCEGVCYVLSTRSAALSNVQMTLLTARLIRSRQMHEI